MYDPKLYVVPVKGGFVLTPFEETVSEALKTATPIGIEAALDAIDDCDVSIWHSSDGSDVSWRHGRLVTAEDLQRAAASCGV